MTLLFLGGVMMGALLVATSYQEGLSVSTFNFSEILKEFKAFRGSIDRTFTPQKNNDFDALLKEFKEQGNRPSSQNNISISSGSSKTGSSSSSPSVVQGIPRIPKPATGAVAGATGANVQPVQTPTSSLRPPVSATPFTECGRMALDPRDGQSYPTVQIGPQCWFARNLNYGVHLRSDQAERDSFGLPYQDNQAGTQKFCYLNTDQTCAPNDSEGSGGMYQWHTAMKVSADCLYNNCSNKIPDPENHQGICPSGWRIPNHHDYSVLLDTLGKDSGDKLKKKQYCWQGQNCNTSGFNGALFGGWDPFTNSFVRYNDAFGAQGFFWLTPDISETDGELVYLKEYSDMSISYPADKVMAYPVRCLRDLDSSASSPTGSSFPAHSEDVLQNTNNSSVVQKASLCTDSDGGKDYFVKGTAEEKLLGGGRRYFEDRCLLKEKVGDKFWRYSRVKECSGSNCSLQEGFCEKGKLTNRSHDCEHGCRDGACISFEKNELEVFGKNNDSVTITAGADDIEMLRFDLLNSHKEEVFATSFGMWVTGTGNAKNLSNFTVALFVNGVQQGSAKNIHSSGLTGFNDVNVHLKSGEKKELVVYVDTIESSGPGTIQLFLRDIIAHAIQTNQFVGTFHGDNVLNSTFPVKGPVITLATSDIPLRETSSPREIAITAGVDDVEVMQIEVNNTSAAEAHIKGFTLSAIGRDKAADLRNFTVALFANGVQQGSAHNLKNSDDGVGFNDIFLEIPSGMKQEFFVTTDTLESSAPGNIQFMVLEIDGINYDIGDDLDFILPNGKKLSKSNPLKGPDFSLKK